MAYSVGNTEERNVKSYPGRCGAAIAKYRILAKGTDGDEFIQASDETSPVFGVSGNAGESSTKVSYEENDPISVKYEGIVFIEMSGTGTRGNMVVSDADGKGIEHLPGNGYSIVGLALNDWVDGDIITVHMNIYWRHDLT